MAIDALRSNAYVQDVLGQPDALRDTLAGLQTLRVGDFQPLGDNLASGLLHRIVLTGMGSSYFALHPLLLTLLAHGLNAQMIETSELIHHAPALLTPETLVVCVSQSGRSAETLQLLRRTRETVPVIGVTNAADSALATESRAAILTYAGLEHSVSCKTYIATLAALSALGGLLIAGDARPILAELQEVPEAVGRYLAQWQRFVESAIAKLDGVHSLILAGRGPSQAAAGTGGLIIKEAACFPAEGMSCAAFRHGPFEMIGPGLFVMIYEGTAPTQALNADIVRDVVSAGGRAALVSIREDGDVLGIPSVPDPGLPILEILPAQMLSLALAVLHDHTPGLFVHASKVTEVE